MKNSSMGCVRMMVETNKPYLGMVLIQLIYAGMALLSKLAVTKGMNPYVFVVYRQALATLALSPFAFFLERELPAKLSCKLLFKIFLVSSGIERVKMSERHGRAKVIGSAVALGGAIVYMYVKGPPMFSATHTQISNPNAKSDSIKGCLIMLGSNISFALYLVAQDPIVKEYPALLRLTNLQCFFTSIQSSIWAVAMERRPSSWNLGWGLNLITVAYCAVVVTAVTYWLRIWVVEKKGPVFVAAFTPMALLFTAIFSAIMWEETFHWGSAGGAVLLVGGLYAVLWGKHVEGKSELKSESEDTEDESKSKEETA
ncbi:WAT1-related protein At1g43650-like isoform X2 [Rhododendron vialii]|uniref:WAT1-related protein At1g43650-like isoform X2 n=1 Tax=Rhododendron vialii TaxID=182163 RepID=UPI00265EC52D|nr:WAT1-related protein At1g43650-like isoform X2 [Rhododendron vialii]